MFLNKIHHLEVELDFQIASNSCKDDKYWERRRKNNLAAKRSRDAKRVKENQVR